MSELNRKVNRIDIVRLKSGGPKMVITHISEDPTGMGPEICWCTWFGSTDNIWGQPASSGFPAYALEVVTDER